MEIQSVTDLMVLIRQQPMQAHLAQEIRSQHGLSLASQSSSLGQGGLGSCFRFPFCLPIFTCVFSGYGGVERGNGEIPHCELPETSLRFLIPDIAFH